MKQSKKILVVIMALCLCTVFTACGSPASNTGGNSTQTEQTEEPVAEDSKDAEATEAPEAEPETAVAEADAETYDPEVNTVKKPVIGIIAWSTGMGDEAEFVNTVQTSLSEQYADQIGEVFVMDSQANAAMFPEILSNMMVRFEGEKAVFLIVNDEDGFSDEVLLSALAETDKAGITVGIDHAIDGAPESTFVYDPSDAAGCASIIMENALK